MSGFIKGGQIQRYLDVKTLGESPKISKLVFFARLCYNSGLFFCGQTVIGRTLNNNRRLIFIMRFILYNIRYGTGRRTRRAWMDILRHTNSHFETITKFIHDLKPDVVGLVEADGGSFRMRRQHQACNMAQAIGHTHHTFGVKYRNNGIAKRLPVFSTQGNALLTCKQIIKEKFHYFKHGLKRLVIELELENATLFLVHLSLRRGVRKRQMAHLQQLVASSSKPCIVAGDFNAINGPKELDEFLSATGLKKANTTDSPTYPSWNPYRVLDFVCYSPSLKLKSCTVPQVTLSDHLPLVCDFEEVEQVPVLEAMAS